LRFDDLLQVSFRQVLRQRRRNIGVALSIAIGTAGLIVVITMGQDVKGNINADLELVGHTTHIKVSFEDYLEKIPFSKPRRFREATLSSLRRSPKVTGVSVIRHKRNVTLYTQQHRPVYVPQLIGVDEYYWEVKGDFPTAGKFFDAEAVRGREKVCVLGENVAKNIFGKINVVGRLLKIDRDLYRVTGVLGGLRAFDNAELVFIPITTAWDRIEGISEPDVMYVRCQTWDDVKSVSAAIREVVAANQDARGLKVRVDWERLKKVKAMAWWIEFFIYIAIIATLTLGGFGIWNIMTAGVQSRTQEIGLKKAIGAEDRDILSQFLAEALCLSLGASVGGIILGGLAVLILASILGSHPSKDLFLFCVGLGLLFSVILGVGAGLAPSIRASRMEVVKAVHFE